MADESNESERKIDALRQNFEKSEIRREKDKQIQEEKMETLRSNLAESLARNGAANQASNARLEAANKDGLARLEAVVSEDRLAAERRDKELHKFISFTVFGAAGLVIAFMGVGLAFLNTSLRSVGAG